MKQTKVGLLCSEQGRYHDCAPKKPIHMGNGLSTQNTKNRGEGLLKRVSWGLDIQFKGL
jgi:hypothetical protein